ncbi:uncharacterized protein HMPREF1541_07422 [Cyphellophora europaea CBS 101466]|uniref:Uncharacterized protein n=1 Tax=Cyphellophora europaea (strain CBS 101466) TaxID=1220924 RepID=W2RPZ0_CYPE1|nr:uncharacterized protein HMPREF1541_07422 [Cyphellophora europaea CBS 101466]ETN37799.1 hypothetical protein HMPREF1541_07422 [Cyphellophora europaea CBS 101466]
MPGAFPELSPPPSPPADMKRQNMSKSKKTKKKAEKKERQQEQEEEHVLDDSHHQGSTNESQQFPTPNASADLATPANTAASSLASLNPEAATFRMPTIPEEAGQVVPTNGRPFSFDSGNRVLICRLPSCDKQTSAFDGKSVACPACGPNSLVRYCSKEHMYADTRLHFLYYCGRFPVFEPIDQNTLAPARARQPRPYLRPTPGANLHTIEHHRQAVYFAMEGDNSGDYFIFDDIHLLREIDTPTLDQVGSCRGKGDLVARIVPPENEDVHDHRKQRFRLLVVRCLNSGASNEQGLKDCIDLAAMIRQDLVNRGSWSEDMITYLTMQMKQEFGFQLPEDMMR